MYNQQAIFNESVRIGKPAVAILEDFYNILGCDVINVEDYKEYQNIDVDLLIDGDKVEVKTDFVVEHRRAENKSLNIYVEYTSCKETGSLGWYRLSRADYILYVLYNKNTDCTVLQFDLSELREYIAMHNFSLLSHLDKKENKTKQAYLVPISVIEKFKTFHTFKIPTFEI